MPMEARRARYVLEQTSCVPWGQGWRQSPPDCVDLELEGERGVPRSGGEPASVEMLVRTSSRQETNIVSHV